MWSTQTSKRLAITIKPNYVVIKPRGRPELKTTVFSGLTCSFRTNEMFVFFNKFAKLDQSVNR